MKSKLMTAALSGLILASNAQGASNSKNTEPSKSPGSTPMGKCEGGNTCKAKSECHTKTNSCAGSNSCKGKGWVTISESDCKSNKGHWAKNEVPASSEAQKQSPPAALDMNSPTAQPVKK